MISFYMHNITPKDVLVKLLTCKHNCEKFLLYLCIPCLSLSKGSGCKSHWLLKLKKSNFQPCVRGVTLESKLMSLSVKMQNQCLCDGSLDVTPVLQTSPLSIFTDQLTKGMSHVRKTGQEFSQTLYIHRV